MLMSKKRNASFGATSNRAESVLRDSSARCANVPKQMASARFMIAIASWVKGIWSQATPSMIL